MKFNTTQDLKNETHRQLAHRMRSDCVLLNTPDHINIGDQLIWQGEIDFLFELGIRPSYQTSLYHFDWRKFSKDTLILLHGGGNFGDVWDAHQGFRLKIIETYKDNEILIFPQSVQYNDKNEILKDATSFSNHKNVTICARDSFSFDLLKEHFSNEILLVPDMAFCSDYSKTKLVNTEKKLLLKRLDREINNNIFYSEFSGFEIHDWPSYGANFKYFSMRIFQKVNRLIGKHFISKSLSDTTFGIGMPWNRENLIRLGVDFISDYNLVVSTRLHGHILALLLGVPTVMVDNNYGKNQRFYDTWLKDNNSSSLASNQIELKKLLDLKHSK